MCIEKKIPCDVDFYKMRRTLKLKLAQQVQCIICNMYANNKKILVFGFHSIDSNLVILAHTQCCAAKSKSYMNAYLFNAKAKHNQVSKIR